MVLPNNGHETKEDSGNKQEAVGLKKFFDISLTECKPLADDHMDSKKRRKRPNQ